MIELDGRSRVKPRLDPDLDPELDPDPDLDPDLDPDPDPDLDPELDPDLDPRPHTLPALARPLRNLAPGFACHELAGRRAGTGGRSLRRVGARVVVHRILPAWAWRIR